MRYNSRYEVDQLDHDRDDDTGGDASLVDYLDTLSRYWWLVLVVTVAAVGAAWWLEREEFPRYSATAIVQRQIDRSPLESTLGPQMLANQTAEAISGQMEVLRSRTVLEQVLNAFGLRLTLPDSREPRGNIFSEVQVDANARPVEFDLRVQPGLVQAVSDGRVIASARPGEWLQLNGVRALVA